MVNKKVTPARTCDKHNCSKKSKVTKCKYCKKYFCKDHKIPRPIGMPNFKAETKADKEFLDEWRKPGGHPCVPYLKQLEVERERANEEYEKHLDELLRKKHKEDDGEIYVAPVRGWFVRLKDWFKRHF